MNQQICLECGEHFEPSRSYQRYCSARCSRRHRERRRLRGEHSSILARSRERARVAEEDGNARLAAAEARFRRALNQQATTAAQHLAREIAEREATIEQLHVRLRQLASANIELSGEMAELTAEIAELRAEMARRADVAEADQHDLIQLAGRLAQLSMRLGFPLDSGAAGIFRRRGWLLPSEAHVP